MDSFWRQHPALLYGIFFYLGVGAALSFSWLIFIPIVAILFPLLFSRERTFVVRICFALSIGLFGVLYTFFQITLPPAGDRHFGVAIVEVEDIVPKERYHIPCLQYTVKIDTMHSFEGELIAKNVFCTMGVKESAHRPKGGIQYEVVGMLKCEADTPSLVVREGSEWKEVSKTWSLVETRYKAKLYFKKFIRGRLAPSDARGFLEGLICGEFADPILSFHLCRFSLQHVMVVSGFHFGLIASCFAALFSTFLSFRLRTVVLIGACTGYLLFLSNTPSVFRAYIAIVVALIGMLLEKKTSGLNTLGVALFVVLFFDPSCFQKLSFQLSFLATFAILLFYPICENGVQKLFPTRSKQVVEKFSGFDQFFYILLSFFKSSWSLTLAVTLVMLPTTLFLFQSFSLIGMIYGCFFPFLAAVSMTWFFIGMIFSFVPYLSDLIFQGCSLFTEAALTFVVHAPVSWGSPTFIGKIPPVVLVLYLTAISYFAMQMRSKDILQERIGFF